MGVFKAYDVRGLYPEEVSEGLAFKIGAALATLHPGKIVVGMDARTSGPSLKQKLIEGILSAGAQVTDVGMIPTPMIIFAINYLSADAGIVVTASHNPKEYNGFKVFGKGGLPISYEDGLDKIEEMASSGKFHKAEVKGIAETVDIKEDYINFLLGHIDIKRPLNMKFVIDTGNGSGGIIYPEVLKRLGAEVHELFTKPDGSFPNHPADPSKLENLEHIRKKVVEVGADLGFAYDGDGDRLAVIDAQGNPVGVGVVFSMLIWNALQSEPGAKVVYTALDSKAISDTIRAQGGTPVLCRVGHTYVQKKMAEEGAAVAGELSGHYYFKETFSGDDAIFAVLKLLETLEKSGKGIPHFRNNMPKYMMATARIPTKESEKFPFIHRLKQEMTDRGYNVDTLEGVKVSFDHGWALFRPSNTEPKISIAYESATEQGFEKMKSFVDDILSRIPKPD